MEEAIVPNEVALMVKEVLQMPIHSVLSIADELMIEDAFEAAAANQLLSRVMTTLKRISIHFEERIKPLNDVKTKLIADREYCCRDLERAAIVLKGKIVRHLSEAKLAAEKELAERNAQAQEELRQRRAAEVEALRAQGELEAAAFVTQEAMTEVAASIKAPKLAVPAGSSLVTTWSAELIQEGGLETLVCAAADDLRLPRDQRRGLLAYLEFNQSAANKIAVAQQTNMNIPGVRIKKHEGLAHSTKRASKLLGK